MSSSRVWLALPIMCTLMIAGCDPIRTTVQDVELQITTSDSAEPVADAEVCLRYDYRRSVPESQQTLEHQQIWDRFGKWFCGTTGQDGKVSVGIVWGALDRNRGPTPPSWWKDFVVGQTYMLTVTTDTAHEELSLLMEPGASVKGTSFAASLLSIQDPRYIPTEQ